MILWEKGFEGVSLTDPTSAMGSSRPSTYAAIGKQEVRFSQAVERYVEGPSVCTALALNKPTVREVATAYIHGAVQEDTRLDRPGGCPFAGLMRDRKGELSRRTPNQDA